MKKTLFRLVAAAVLIAYWFLNIPTPVFAVVFVGMLFWAWRVDKENWHAKTSAELAAMLKGSKWRLWSPALSELRRREEDISPFIPRLLSALVSDSQMQRLTAQKALARFFPKFKEQLSGYSYTQNPATSRQKLSPLLVEYRIRC